MANINGINLNESRENPPENDNKNIIVNNSKKIIYSDKTAQSDNKIESENFEEMLSLIENSCKIIRNTENTNLTENIDNDENIVSLKNNDMKIFIENDTGKIHKIENYQIQINIIPNNETEKPQKNIAFVDYMSIISSLNKIEHNIN